MNAWEFKVPLAEPISLNQRQHWRAKAEKVAVVRKMAFMLVKHHKIPKDLGRIKVTLTYHPRTKRRRDALNLVATLKAFEDGLVDAKLIPDDTDEFLEPTMPRIGELSTEKLAYFTARIEQLPVAAG